jgi:hypothetical protein
MDASSDEANSSSGEAIFAFGESLKQFPDMVELDQTMRCDQAGLHPELHLSRISQKARCRESTKSQPAKRASPTLKMLLNRVGGRAIEPTDLRTLC